MSLDSAAGANAAAPNPLQFVNIEIMPLAGGWFSVAMQATLLDEQELTFIGQDLAHERVATLDQALAIIRQNVAVLAPPSARDGAMAWFRNFYRCARCGHEWSDAWSATCDDDCPECGARHMSPYKSEDIEAEDGDG